MEPAEAVGTGGGDILGPQDVLKCPSYVVDPSGALGLDLRSGRRCAHQFNWADVERNGEGTHGIETSSAASLEALDVAPMNTGAGGQFFLQHAALNAPVREARKSHACCTRCQGPAGEGTGRDCHGGAHHHSIVSLPRCLYALSTL